MEKAITATLPPDDLAALDRVCRDQGVSRHDAVESAVRWYIEREGL
jgi:metal-responsive CopG/Arc/MetJ family transcriptional regulator